MAESSVAEVKEALAQVGYLADEPAALVSYLAQELGAEDVLLDVVPATLAAGLDPQ